LNSVLEADVGLVASFDSENEVKTFRSNCYAFRKLDQNSLNEGLDVLDPKRDKSPYRLIRFTTLINRKKNEFKLIMKNCTTMLEVAGVKALVDISSGQPIEPEFEEKMPVELADDLFDEAQSEEKTTEGEWDELLSSK
jgi:hypothetical protein